MIILVRHALAVPRTEWAKADAHRPLTPRGERQAAALIALLDDVAVDSVLSSPTVRCKATVRPLARRLDKEIDTSRSLKEGHGARAVDLVLDATDDLLVCTHGDVVGAVLTGLRRVGWPVPHRPRKAKGSIWLLSHQSCTYVPPGA